MTEQPLVELTIESLGAAGDGVANHQGLRYYIADSLPGDRLRVRVTSKRGDGFAARTVERLSQGPHRTAPACRHFNDCGGCAAQHLDDEIYESWKRRRVIEALARRGLGVVLTSLDPDSWGRPFHVVERLRPIAGESVSLQATCARCDAVASRTQRLTPIVHGNMADGPENYEPRCPACWTPPPEPAPSASVSLGV